MKYVVWDFDGTLGYRRGMWSGAMIELLDQERPEHTMTADQLQPYLQEGFPWHAPDQPHPDLATADEWWATLAPIFERAYEGVGVAPLQAQQLAQKVRSIYLAADRWDDMTMRFQHSNRFRTAGGHISSSRITFRNCRRLSSRSDSLPTSLGRSPPRRSSTKRHPNAFQTVLDAVEEDDPAVWMIGDSMSADIAGAEAVDIPGILVRRSHENATHYCADLSGVPAIVSADSTA